MRATLNAMYMMVFQGKIFKIIVVPIKISVTYFLLLFSFIPFLMPNVNDTIGKTFWETS